MLIQALCEYYDVLAAKGKLASQGFSSVDISYIISLTQDGKMDGIIDCRTTEKYMQNNKPKEKLIPKCCSLPKRTEKTAIDANIVEHRPLYIFGLNYDADKQSFTPKDDKHRAVKSHQACVEANIEFMEGLFDPICIAYKAFLQNWEPEKEMENPELLKIGKGFDKVKYAFCLSGNPHILLHENAALREKWSKHFLNSENNDAEIVAQCGITGDELPIARIHDKIRKIPGGSAMGNTLISFNNPSEYSYGQEQSFNSNISQRAMVKYTQALNYLMETDKHRTLLDDVTIFHWAASGNERCDDIFNCMLIPDKLDAEDTENAISAIVNKLTMGVVREDVKDVLADIDADVDFYIAGFKPNSSRLAISFIYRKKFGQIIENILQHHEDMRLETTTRPAAIRWILKELVSPKSKNEKVSPAMNAKLLDAILYGGKYPESMLSTVIRRIRTDCDEEKNNFIKMNPTRMGLLKAYINRNNRLNNKEEEITMAWNENNTNPAYLCGALFAVLENIQQQAAGYNLNRTIKDAYFATASARPAQVFPVLLKLALHHLKKLKYSVLEEKKIQAIADKLDNEFPTTLSLKDQGVFMLGYYQKKSDIDRIIKENKANKEDK